MSISRKWSIAWGFIALVVIFILVIIIGNDRPLNNVRYEDGFAKIELSDGEADKSSKIDFMFIVPETFNPQATKSTFSFFLKYTDGSAYSGNDTPRPEDQVRVVVVHKNNMMSEYLLKRSEFFANKDGLEIYQYKVSTTIRTLYKITAENGEIVLVEDPGDWAVDYQVYRKFNDAIELEYQFSKKLIHAPDSFIKDFTPVDLAVINVVKSFQAPAEAHLK